MTRREALIVGLLRARDYAIPADSARSTASGDRLPMQPHSAGCQIRLSSPPVCTCWLRSMLELELRMRELRAESWAWWMSVVERYVACERRPRVVQVRHGRPVAVRGMEVLGALPERQHGPEPAGLEPVEPDSLHVSRKGEGQARMVVESWSARAVESDWLAGVAWLANAFTGPLELPSEMVDRHAV